MGEMKVEHVLLFLVGAFLAYHIMGNCGCKRVEGFKCGYPYIKKEFPVGCECDPDNNGDECASRWCFNEDNTCQDPDDPNNVLTKEAALIKAGKELRENCAKQEWLADEPIRRQAFCAEIQEGGDSLPGMPNK